MANRTNLQAFNDFITWNESCLYVKVHRGVFATGGKGKGMIDWRRFRNGSGKDGQAMVEYIVMAGILLASLAILTLFLVTFQEYGYRIVDMVASDYP